ncbi:MAG: hypothetical protein ACTSR3_05790 [Candidatus Helarchaeota archaeon]
MLGKVENLGEKAQKYAIRLKVEGLSHSAIADELNSKFNSDLTGEQVRNFLRRKESKTFQILKEDRNFQYKLAKQYFNSMEQLNWLNEEMTTFFQEIKNDPEYSSRQVYCPKCNHKFRVQLKAFGTFLKTADHLLNQIKHVDAVLGRMQKKSLNITYNYVDLSQKLIKVIPQLFHDAERKGIIKIIKKKKLKEI